MINDKDIDIEIDIKYWLRLVPTVLLSIYLFTKLYHAYFIANDIDLLNPIAITNSSQSEFQSIPELGENRDKPVPVPKPVVEPEKPKVKTVPKIQKPTFPRQYYELCGTSITQDAKTAYFLDKRSQTIVEVVEGEKWQGFVLEEVLTDRAKFQDIPWFTLFSEKFVEDVQTPKRTIMQQPKVLPQKQAEKKIITKVEVRKPEVRNINGKKVLYIGLKK